MKTINHLKWGRAIIVMALPVLLGIGPCTGGPRWLERIPGGVLNGEVVTEPVTDWSFVSEAGLCALETRPDFPHSIIVNCFNDGPDLYVGCMSCDGKAWSTYVMNNPVGRIRVGDRIHAVNLRRVTDADAMQGPWVSRWEKTRGNTDAPPIPSGYWLFQLTSRQTP
ncbi:MAG: hypothetical protein ACFHX7_03640 [Pseudomonadota bacterium]